MVASRLFITAFLGAALGCGHPTSQFDRLLASIDQRDSCIERVVGDLASPDEEVVNSPRSTVHGFLLALPADLREQLAEIARRALDNGGLSGFGDRMRIALSDVDLFSIKGCGGIAAEALPNALLRNVSEEARDDLARHFNALDSRDLEGYVLTAVALESIGFEWEAKDITDERGK